MPAKAAAPEAKADLTAKHEDKKKDQKDQKEE